MSFSASATGPGVLQYRWQLNGADVPGGVASTLSIGGARAANAGEYRLIVSNGGGSATSHVALLTVVVERTLAVISPGDEHEGDLVAVPLLLASSGEVGGMTITLNFNPDYLAFSEKR